MFEAVVRHRGIKSGADFMTNSLVDDYEYDDYGA